MGIGLAGVVPGVIRATPARQWVGNVFTPGGGIITGYPRQNVFLGMLFDGVGAALLGVSLYHIVNAG